MPNNTTVQPVSSGITSKLSSIPGGYSLYGVVEVEKTITCNTTTYYLEKDLSFQLVFMQVCPPPTTPPLPPSCTCGFSAANQMNTNNVKFPPDTAAIKSTLTLDGTVCKGDATSAFMFTALAQNAPHSITIEANSTNNGVTSVTCTSLGGGNCDIFVSGKGTIYLDGGQVSNPNYELTIHCAGGNTTYELRAYNGKVDPNALIFDTIGQVSTTNVACVCPS